MYNDAVKAALSGVGTPFFHDAAHKQTDDYIVWRETGLESVINEHAVYNLEIHHYTKNEYSEIPKEIINALRDTGFTGIKKAAIEFSANTGVTHTAITAAWGTTGEEAVVALVKRYPQGSDDYGAPVWTETETTVTAIISGRKWSEVYAALSAGLKPEITIQLPAIQYSEEKVIRFDDIDYQITGAELTDGGLITITCEDIAKAG